MYELPFGTLVEIVVPDAELPHLVGKIVRGPVLLDGNPMYQVELYDDYKWVSCEWVKPTLLRKTRLHLR